jgi:hypothetical protein
MLNIQERIRSFKDLKDGWDGYSAKPIPDKVIERALILSQIINNGLIEVFPTARESIQFETKTDKNYIEIEVFYDKIELYSSHW